MPSCIVKGCTNNTRNRPEGVGFHRFPKGQHDIWKRAIGQPTVILNKQHRVCSVHFQESDYNAQYSVRRRLKPNAVPSQMLNKPTFKRKLAFAEVKQVDQRATTMSPLISLPSSSSSTGSRDQQQEFAFDMPSTSAPNKRKMPTQSISSSTTSNESGAKAKQVMLIKSVHTYSRSPSHYKTQLAMKAKQVGKYRGRLYTAHKKIKRLKRNISDLKQLVKVLRKTDKISSDASRMLESTFSGIPLIIMKRLLTNLKAGKNTRRKFPIELKNFAMTLQFYSPKAYDFVRRSFNLCLPAPSVIRSWLSKVDCEPGYSKPALDMLKIFVKQKHEKGEVALCAMMFDEMSIRKQVDIEGGNLMTRGYVDIGAGPTEDTTLASEAFVIMLVCVNGYFKLPIAYFLINKLSGEEKAQIVLETLKIVYDIGAAVVSVTCDGPNVNFSMAKTLGCQLSLDEEMKTWFPHPSDETRIYMIFDICHMLKLIRNNWAKLRQFVNGKGEIIDWRFIEMLFALQEAETLKLANKLSRVHIDWKTSAMKVNVAAQTLSNSVAKALAFLKDDMQLPEFQNAGPTIEFIQMINNLFDILNSRNPFGRGYKTPLRAENEGYWRPFLEDSITSF